MNAGKKAFISKAIMAASKSVASVAADERTAAGLGMGDLDQGMADRSKEYVMVDMAKELHELHLLVCSGLCCSFGWCSVWFNVGLVPH